LAQRLGRNWVTGIPVASLVRVVKSGRAKILFAIGISIMGALAAARTASAYTPEVPPYLEKNF
jgi:hypothetical protein